MRRITPIFALLLMPLFGCSYETGEKSVESGILEADDLGISKHTIPVSRKPNEATVIEIRIFENEELIEAREHVSTNWKEKNYSFISMNRSFFTGEKHPDYVVRFPHEIIEIGDYYQVSASYSSSRVDFGYRSFSTEPNLEKRIEFKIFTEEFDVTKNRIPDAAPRGWHYSAPIINEFQPDGGHNSGSSAASIVTP